MIYDTTTHGIFFVYLFPPMPYKLPLKPFQLPLRPYHRASPIGLLFKNPKQGLDEKMKEDRIETSNKYLPNSA